MTTKKQLVARGIAGALSLCGVLGLVGCGAETGDEAAEIGSTAEALSVANASANIPNGRQYAASCVLHDSVNNKDLLLVAAGINGTSGLPTNTSDLFDPSATPKWAASVETFGTDGTGGTADDRRLNAKMIQVPGHSNQCLLVGGDNGSGTFRTTTFLYTLGSGWTSAGSLPAVRKNFELAGCGTGGEILAIGGKNSGGTVLKTMDRWTYNSTTWAVFKDNATPTPNNIELNQERFDFAAAANASGKILIAGGNDGSSRLNDLEVLIPTSSCSTATPQPTTLSVTLGSSRDKLSMAFIGTVSSKEKFAVVGGVESGPTASDDVDFVNVDFTTTSNSTRTNPASALSAGIVYPLLAKVATDQFIVANGETVAGASLNNVIEYNAGTRTTSTLGTTRHGAAAGYLASQSKVYVAAGLDTGSPPDVLVTEAITP